MTNTKIAACFNLLKRMLSKYTKNAKITNYFHRNGQKIQPKKITKDLVFSNQSGRSNGRDNTYLISLNLNCSQSFDMRQNFAKLKSVFEQKHSGVSYRVVLLVELRTAQCAGLADSSSRGRGLKGSKQDSSIIILHQWMVASLRKTPPTFSYLKSILSTAFGLSLHCCQNQHIVLCVSRNQRGQGGGGAGDGDGGGGLPVGL